MLTLLHRACCAEDSLGQGVDMRAGVCECAALLAAGIGCYVCPEVVARAAAGRLASLETWPSWGW